MSSRALILCVDDEPVNLMILEELLQDSYELTSARSGAGCLQQVEMQKPDLILLDVNMPDIDGLETCARLKADPETAEIPIIFVSALASQEELMAGYEADSDDYITKPFSEDINRPMERQILGSLRGQDRVVSFGTRLALSSDHVAILVRNLPTTRDNLGQLEELHQRQKSRAA